MQICRITSVLLLSNYNFVLGGKRKSGSELTLPDSVIYGFVLLFNYLHNLYIFILYDALAGIIV